MESVASFQFKSNEENLNINYFYSNLPSFMSSLNVNQTNSADGDGQAAVASNSDDSSDAFDGGISTDSDKHVSSRRSLRARPSKSAKSSSSSTENLLKIKRRSIAKPRRLSQSAHLKTADIKKLYLQNKVPNNFKPTNLETIFEEDCDEDALTEPTVNFIGAKKMKRSISLPDGFNLTKTMIKNRRNKIKKKFGKRFALKKVPLSDFIAKLNSSYEDDKSNERLEASCITKQAEEGENMMNASCQ